MLERKMESDETTPLVSVLMPCYNHSSYVIDALESIAASDYANIEIVFIDDASKDESYNAACKWLEVNSKRFVRVVHIRHSKNQGICSTVNELLDLAKGDFVNFAASDDLVLPNGISGQVSFSRERNADFLFTDSQLMDEFGKLFAESALEYFGKSKNKLSKNSICLMVDIIINWQLPWNRFFARTLSLKALGGFNTSLIFEDRDLALRILNQGVYAFMPESVTCYRYTGRHTIGLSREGMLRDFSKADIQNFHGSSGLVKLFLALVVFTDEEKYQHGGFVRNLFNWVTIKLSRRIYRVILKIHRMLIA